jgi:hypothetical protein
MVDVQAVNQKLVRRSEDMLLRLTSCGRHEVRQALGRAHGDVKLAVLLLRGCDIERESCSFAPTAGFATRCPCWNDTEPTRLDIRLAAPERNPRTEPPSPVPPVCA